MKKLNLNDFFTNKAQEGFNQALINIETEQEKLKVAVNELEATLKTKEVQLEEAFKNVDLTTANQLADEMAALKAEIQKKNDFIERLCPENAAVIKHYAAEALKEVEEGFNKAIVEAEKADQWVLVQLKAISDVMEQNIAVNRELNEKLAEHAKYFPYVSDEEKEKFTQKFFLNYPYTPKGLHKTGVYDYVNNRIKSLIKDTQK